MIEAPRFETGRPMLIAGVSGHYGYDTVDQVPALWQRFALHIGRIPGEVEGVAYGVCTRADTSGFDYMAGVEVADNAGQSAGGQAGEFEHLQIPAQRYAVFHHRDHISSIRQTMQAIWTEWLPQSGHAAAEAPVFERYDHKFDPQTGLGGVEIWLPLKA